MRAACWTSRPRHDMPVGTSVLAFPGGRDGRAVVTRTRSEVWYIGDGTPVVSVESLTGGIALTHIEVMPVGGDPS